MLRNWSYTIYIYILFIYIYTHYSILFYSYTFMVFYVYHFYLSKIKSNNIIFRIAKFAYVDWLRYAVPVSPFQSLAIILASWAR